LSYILITRRLRFTLFPYTTLFRSIPALEEIHNDGESGRRKLNQWTRMITVPLAIVQSVAFIYILRQTILVTSSVDIADPTLTQRSEEHTSELQSRENLVCRLLLEK